MDKIKIITAGVVLNKEKNKILLIKRSDQMWKDNWSIPGGHVEFNETVEDALKRELKEELSLDIIDIEFLAFEEFYAKNKKFISLNFIVFAKENILINEKEIKDAKWFNFNELSKINNKIPKEGVDYVNRLLKEN